MKKRKYGIDLLRIVSMLLIVVLHVLRQGGILLNTETGSTSYHLAWLMEIVAICAVNCYGLISGYVNVSGRVKYHKLAVMWLQVVFYTVLITLFYEIFNRGSISAENWKTALTPVVSQTYWYFTAYFALFLAMPFLNIMINNLSNKQLKVLGATIFILFSVIPTITTIDIFFTKNGYTFLWLMLLYIMGAVMKKLEVAEKVKTYQWVLLAAVSIAASYIFKIIIDKSDTAVDKELLFRYSAITVVLQSFAFVAIAIKLNIKNKTAVSIIKFISPLSFSVYIIHTNPWIFHHALKNCVSKYADERALKMLIAVGSAVLIIFFACIAIDYVRSLIFRLIKISPALEKLENKVRRKINDKN